VETGHVRHSLLPLAARRVGLELQRLRDEEAITRSRDTALAATEAKSRFLANVSHEIRTPMNGIIGFSNLLLREVESPRQRAQVEMIAQSAQSLLGIINDILDISKIEAGKMDIHPAPCTLHETLEDLVSMFAYQAHQKGLELCLAIDSRLPLVLVTDAQRLVQVLTNLLGNAIKFTDRGTVMLEVGLHLGSDSAHGLLLRVLDTGIGIPPADRERLFEAFAQLESTHQRRYSGTGLGLAICHQLVTLLGGEIGVDDAPSGGSCFWVSLPLESVGGETLGDRFGRLLHGQRVLLFETNAQVREANARLLNQVGAETVAVASDSALAARLAATDADFDLAIIAQPVSEASRVNCDARLPLVRQHHAGEVLVLNCSNVGRFDSSRCASCPYWCVPKPLTFGLLARGPLRTPGGEAGESVPHAARPGVNHDLLSGYRMLVVDDSLVNRALLKALLEEWGASVDEAEDGEQAVQLASSQHYHMVFMDLQMPRVSGSEAAARIRRQAGTRRPPLVALTATVFNDGHDAEALHGLFDALVSKPIDEAQLLETLHTCLRFSDSGALRTRHDGAPADGPPSAGTHEVLFDAARAARVTGGRIDIAHRLLRLFLEELPEHRERLESCWQAGDIGGLKQALHKLRGAADYCALTGISAAAESIEKELSSGRSDRLDWHINHLGAELERVAAGIPALLEQGLFPADGEDPD
jgi:two-component system sensor histidine kinase BarA